MARLPKVSDYTTNLELLQQFVQRFRAVREAARAQAPGDRGRATAITELRREAAAAGVSSEAIEACLRFDERKSRDSLRGSDTWLRVLQQMDLVRGILALDEAREARFDPQPDDIGGASQNESTAA